jgi:nucleoid-associated protein YgaU
VDVVRRCAPIVAWVVGLAALLAVMAALGHGALAPPDLRRPTSWGQWAADRTAAEAAVAVLRLVVLALAAYLLVVTVLAVGLRLGRAGRLVTVADVFTLPFVRSLVQAGIGVGLAGAAVAAVGSVAVGHHGPGGPPTAADAALVSWVTSSEVVMQPLPAEGAPPVMQKLDADAPAEAPADDERTWTVAAGEHFWSIATNVLAGTWGRPPADRELTPYWEQLVDANRSRLADPGNPDLLFPGQQLVVPAPPPAP